MRESRANRPGSLFNLVEMGANRTPRPEGCNRTLLRA